MGVELGLHEQLLFVGYLSRDGDLEDCYRAGDGRAWCFRRPWPFGVPVVSTAVMGTREALDGGEGYLIAADDEADFSAKTVRLLFRSESAHKTQ